MAFGDEYAYRSTDGGTTGFKPLARDTLHADVNALRFSAPGVLFAGTDGGIWKSTNFSTAGQTPSWTNLNGNLANAEFYKGTIDQLNYGTSIGGTQDNGHIKGGNPSTWSNLPSITGDSTTMIIDPPNSNIGYFTDLGGNVVGRTTDGGLSFPTDIDRSASVGSCHLPMPLTYQNTPLVMDPNDHNTLVAYSANSDPGVKS